MDLKHELAKATKCDPEIGRILTVAAEMFVADRGAPPEDLLQLINYIKPVIAYLERFKFERAPDCKNDLELFSDHRQFAEADAAIRAGLEHAKTLPDWDTARAHMQAVQDRYTDVGANDSEPRNHIVDALNSFYACARLD